MSYHERRTCDDAITGVSRWWVPIYLWRYCIAHGLLQGRWRWYFCRDTNFLR
jgi:hypothetical protein